jgi:prepilin peptidase CpaA
VGVLVLVSVAATIAFLIASYFDIRHRTIPNSLPVAVAGAGVVKWLMIAHLAAALWAVAAALLVFGVTAILFTQGWIGGGDVKLAAASVFFLGAPAAPQFLLLMALFGGVIALGMLIGVGYARRSSRAKAASIVAPAEPPTLPYGVAIAAAAIATVALDGRGLWAM